MRIAQRTGIAILGLFDFDFDGLLATGLNPLSRKEAEAFVDMVCVKRKPIQFSVRSSKMTSYVLS